MTVCVCMTALIFYSLSHSLSLSLPLSHVTVFCPGDEGLFWYTVIQGSLEMLKSDMETSKVITIQVFSFPRNQLLSVYASLRSLSLSLSHKR